MNVPPPEGAATPYRASRLIINAPLSLANQPAWSITRNGKDIQPGVVADLPSSRNVMLLPSGSWTLESYQSRNLWEQQAANGGILTVLLGDLEVAPGMVERPFVTAFTPGGPDPGVTTLGCYWQLKAVSAAGLYHQEIVGDTATYPAPPLPGILDYPMDRVARARYSSGRHFANGGYFFRFKMPSIPASPLGLFAVFYFGNTADSVSPSSFTAGRYAIQFYGNGRAELYEWTGLAVASSSWKLVHKFVWALPGSVYARDHSILVIPEGNNKLNIIPQTAGDLRIQGHLFTATEQNSGYTSKSTMTGPNGQPRVDVRRDLRMPFQLGGFDYDPNALFPFFSSGWITGMPFALPYPVPAGTPIRIGLTKDDLNGTSVTVRLFEATTGGELTPDASGAFPSLAGKKTYYPVIQLFTSDTTTPPGLAAPFLRFYTASIPATRSLTNNATPYTGGSIQAYEIQGPSRDGDSEGGTVIIEDPQAELHTGPLSGGVPTGEGGLSDHAGMRVKLQTRYDTNPDHWCTLLDGMMVVAHRTRWGKEAQIFHHSQAGTYHVELQGQHAWLAQPTALNEYNQFFMEPDPTGFPGLSNFRGRLVTDILKDGLTLGIGYADSQVAGIANNPNIRLFITLDRPYEYLLQPGKPLMEFFQHLAVEYLGGILAWDANYPPDGSWVLLKPPVYSSSDDYDFKFSFWEDTRGMVSAGRQVHLPGAWKPLTSYVELGSEWFEAPEANYVRVIAAPAVEAGTPYDPIVPGPNAATCVRYIHNPRAHSWDPAAPTAQASSFDYTDGRLRAVTILNPALNVDNGGPLTKSAVAFVCRRLFDAIAYGKRWRSPWTSPLILIPHESGQGVRPLRFGDVVLYNDEPVIIATNKITVDVSEGGDRFQRNTLTGWHPVIPLPMTSGSLDVEE